jgi:adenylyltransferase/sulfurtransferase
VPSCAEGGVLGALPGVVGALQATEALKLLIGQGQALLGRLLVYDALAMEFTELRLRKDPACPACGTHEIQALHDDDASCAPPGAAEPEVFDLAPFEVAPRMAQGSVLLVDVREPVEWDVARIEGAQLIPLRLLPERTHQLPRDRDIVVYCHTGMRSAQAVGFLRTLGFRRVWNLAGGIDLWSEQVDPAVPRY